MKLSKLLLTSTTALGLSMTAAMADDNTARLDQSGSDNTALIEQSGVNQVFGSATRDSVQEGDRNELDVDQSGDGNSVGLTTNPAGGRAGFVQDNDVAGDANANTATITQSDNRNSVGAILQVTRDFGAPFVSGNTLTIDQSGDDNTLGGVRQDRNSPASVGNEATITMSGTDNFLNFTSQFNRGGSAAGEENTIDATISGEANGRDRDTGAVAGLRTFSAMTGVEANALVQDGFANDINLNVSGNWNRVGIEQDGDNNSVGSLDISGNNNTVGIAQDGSFNLVTLSPLTGFFNDIGVSQAGVTNQADLDVDGSANAFKVDQNGVENLTTLSITGNDNGEGRAFQDPTRADALAAITAGASIGMDRGIIVQMGDDNVVTHDVSGNGNVFAFGQEGNGNEIVGTQTSTAFDPQNGTFGNQVAVYQGGNSNLASFSQIGSGNTMGIVQ